jgi:hypothetical protein
LPDQPISIREVPAPGRPAHRSLRARGHQWRRTLSRFARTKRGRWILIASACTAVLLVALLAQGFLTSPAPSVGPPGAAGGDQSLSSLPAPSPSKVKAKAATANDPRLVRNPLAQLRGRFPDNPLYLVPTGLGSAYGSVGGHPRSWSISEQALGSGYLAAIFIQTGKSGTPITCRITVDGKVTSTETTSGGYGRALCLG